MFDGMMKAAAAAKGSISNYVAEKSEEIRTATEELDAKSETPDTPTTDTPAESSAPAGNIPQLVEDSPADMTGETPDAPAPSEPEEPDDAGSSSKEEPTSDAAPSSEEGGAEAGSDSRRNSATADSAEVTTEQIGATPVTTGGRDHCPQSGDFGTENRTDKCDCSRLPHPAVCYIDEDGMIFSREEWIIHGKPNWDREIHWKNDELNEFSDEEVPADIARRFRAREKFDPKQDASYAKLAMDVLRNWGN